jgi:nitroimidazol reductase NimA-like FMN-containing flavoprotein (pyridoxamine 5'-phosphate oxidase superfamily)
MTSPLPQNATTVRRKNREVVDEAWIRAFLHRSPMCALATVRDGWPFLNSNLFVFDETAHVLYIHTGGGGRTHSNIEADSRVCVSVSEMGRLLPGEKVTDYSVEYASVIIFGRASVVSNRDEVRSVLDRQLDKYFPHMVSGRDYAPFTDEEAGRAAVYRIEIEEWSAKQHQEAEDFPGAFWYSARSAS